MSKYVPHCGKRDYTRVEGDSRLSTRNFLITHEIIDSFDKVLNQNELFRASNWLLGIANDKYGYYTELPFKLKKDGLHVDYNEAFFKKVDGVKLQIEKKKREQEEKKRIEEERKRIIGEQGEIEFEQFQKLTIEEKTKTIEQVTKEHRSITALKDLAAKLAHRIGGKVEFVNRTDVDWKGYNQGMTSVLNEAYMTSDTPFHEILAHPIIRAIKFKDDNASVDKSKRFSDEYFDYFRQLQQEGKSIKEAEELSNKKFYIKENTLYQSLLKELETSETGRKVFEQVKRDYTFKKDVPYISTIDKDVTLYYDKNTKTGYIHDNNNPSERKTFNSEQEVRDYLNLNDKYTLEDQQEEAIVTLLGLMAADKLDKIKDATLISKLKELWKQISDFVKSLLTGNISENEINNIIENEVTYTDEKNNLCAKDGIRSSKFTKGSQWKIVKDLKGYPTHKEGGVDLTIGKDGVNIRNGNTEFIAKHGLVIPNN